MPNTQIPRLQLSAPPGPPVGFFQANQSSAQYRRLVIWYPRPTTSKFRGLRNLSGKGATALDAELVGTTATVAYGLRGPVMRVDGASSYAKSGDIGAVWTTPSYPVVLMCWVRFAAAFVSAEIVTQIGINNSNNQNLRILRTTGGVMAAAARTTSGDSANGTTVLTTGEWYHVAGIFRGPNHREIFVNGKSEATDSGNKSLSGSTQVVAVGATSNGGSALNGDLMDVRIYTPDQGGGSFDASALVGECYRDPWDLWWSPNQSYFDFSAAGAVGGTTHEVDSAVGLSAGVSKAAQWTALADVSVDLAAGITDAGALVADVNAALAQLAGTASAVAADFGGDVSIDVDAGIQRDGGLLLIVDASAGQSYTVTLDVEHLVGVIEVDATLSILHQTALAAGGDFAAAIGVALAHQFGITASQAAELALTISAQLGASAKATVISASAIRARRVVKLEAAAGVVTIDAARGIVILEKESE